MRGSRKGFPVPQPLMSYFQSGSYNQKSLDPTLPVRYPSVRRSSVKQTHSNGPLSIALSLTFLGQNLYTSEIPQSDVPRRRFPQSNSPSQTPSIGPKQSERLKLCIFAAVQYFAVPHHSTAFQVKWDGLNARVSGSTVHRELPLCREVCRNPSKMQKHLKTKHTLRLSKLISILNFGHSKSLMNAHSVSI